MGKNNVSLEKHIKVLRKAERRLQRVIHRWEWRFHRERDRRITDAANIARAAQEHKNVTIDRSAEFVHEKQGGQSMLGVGSAVVAFVIVALLQLVALAVDIWQGSGP